MALNYVTVTGTFDDGSGTALAGTVTFTPSETVYYAGVPVASTASPIAAQVINGALKSPTGGTLQLLATDNAGVTFEGLTGFWFWSVSVNVGGTGQSWSFFLPHSPATVDLYSLANTVAAGGFTSPMTTLGDIIYENATPAAARLPGSTSATKQFLTQTGTGSVSAAPAWGAIAAADLPANTLTPNLGIVLQTLPGPWAATTGSQAAANEIVVSLATAYQSVTLGHLATWIGGAGVTPGTGINALAIYSEAGALLGNTGDMTTAFEAVGWAQAALTSGVPVTAGTNYYLAYQNNFTGTLPAIPGYVPPPSSGVPQINGHWPHLYFTGTTSWPSSLTIPGTGTNGLHWFYVAGLA